MPRSGSGRGGATGAPRGVVVFACGDPLRGDDAVAWLAVEELPAQTPAGVDVRLLGALEAEHLIGLPAGTRVVLVDAVVGPPAGEIVEMDLAEMSGSARRVVTTSSHQLPLDRVVALAQLLRDEPLVGRFVGVGVGSVAIGDEPSAAVADSIPTLRAAVVGALSRLLGTPGSKA